LKRVRLSGSEEGLYGLRENDLVINRVNSLEYLGKSAIIPRLAEPTVFESNMMRFRVDEKRIHPRFLIGLLQTRFIRSQVLTGAKNAVNQSSINQQDVKGFRIIAPPISQQNEFAKRVAAVELQQSHQVASQEKLDALFDSLQHRAFRGEL
jgi:type I restriction enzyme S subunit